MKQSIIGLVLAAGLVGTLATKPAAASYCTDTPLATLTSAPYTTPWGAYQSLSCVEEHLVAAGDRRAIFASVYTLTTLRIVESIDSGSYVNTAWMTNYTTEFANHYRTALRAYALGNRSQVPNAWLRAFDAAASGQTLIIQDVLLGMNAHINFDLPFAIEAVKISPNTKSRYADHQRVNAVLAAIGDEIFASLAALYGPNYGALDSALGQLDELLLTTGMSTARQNAWNNAVLLSASAPWNRWLVVGGIDLAAVSSANLTLGLTLSPTLRNTLRALEGSNPGSTFCQHFTCSI